MKMKAKELLSMGWIEGPCIGEAMRCTDIASSHGLNKEQIKEILEQILVDHSAYLKHPWFGSLAQLVDSQNRQPYLFKEQSDSRAAYKIWGISGIGENTLEQMDRAVSIPVAARGALMPDAHLGYGIPIGGVLALDNAVMPYGVGVDIACRMMLSVTDIPIDNTDPIVQREGALTKAIEKHTRFGMGASFGQRERRQHEVMDLDWSILNGIVDKDRAWEQLGTSGGGNHFVDIGEIEFLERFYCGRWIEPGKYLAILTHSGSRGLGAKTAAHFTKIAESKHPLIPTEYKKLSWLSMDDEDGISYWLAMELAGKYASACHHVIHESLLNELGFNVQIQVENHHNFAWKEVHDGKEVIVHRKGATPAGEGVLGIIPGSMAAPGFLVRGRGNVDSLNSAAHGAGRAMSRRKANETYKWASVNDQLKHKKVKLISGGLDEVPGAYKPIAEVMSAQKDLVDIIAKFDPRLVKMADDGFAED